MYIQGILAVSDDFNRIRLLIDDEKTHFFLTNLTNSTNLKIPYTKNTKNVNALNKLQISEGSIVNVYNSQNANLKTLKYNNVYFMPEANISNIVNLFTIIFNH